MLYNLSEESMTMKGSFTIVVKSQFDNDDECSGGNAAAARKQCVVFCERSRWWLKARFKLLRNHILIVVVMMVKMIMDGDDYEASNYMVMS